MKIRVSTVFLLVLLSFSGCSEQKSGTYVEALYYRDGNPVIIQIVDGKIGRIKYRAPVTVDPALFVAPGLIDIQVNGYMGVDFSDQDLTLGQMQEATKALWKEGVTSYLPTLITRDHERLERSFSILAASLDDPVIGASIPGFHLEGPYISPVQGFRGAHPEQYIRLPDWNEFSAFQGAAHNGIRLITVAPEMEGAIPFIRQCVASGVVVSLGHHNGTPENIELAVEAGATLSTHLGNGCANEINRHHNPLWPQLANDSLSITIISDGSHLTREEVRTFYKVKGPDRTILVSDALSFAGLPPGEYEKDGMTYLLTPDVVKFPSENVLAGAAMPISRCVGNIMKFTGCSLNEAIRMASTNPARLMGLDNLGQIRPGKRADLVLFTMENGEMVVQKTIVAGEVVYSKN